MLYTLYTSDNKPERSLLEKIATVSERYLPGQRETLNTRGIVECEMSPEFILELINDSAGKLLVATRDDGSFIGHTIYFTDEESFPEEIAGELPELLPDYRPLSFLYYMVIDFDAGLLEKIKAARGMFRQVKDDCRDSGCAHLIADHMVAPWTCAVGKFMSWAGGFKPTGKTYGGVEEIPGQGEVEMTFSIGALKL